MGLAATTAATAAAADARGSAHTHRRCRTLKRHRTVRTACSTHQQRAARSDAAHSRALLTDSSAAAAAAAAAAVQHCAPFVSFPPPLVAFHLDLRLCCVFRREPSLSQLFVFCFCLGKYFACIQSFEYSVCTGCAITVVVTSRGMPQCGP